jgi:hypothetical protein
MKLKITNIIAILLVIIIVGTVLYIWSKHNIEKFAVNSATSNLSNLDLNDLLSRFDSVFNNILQTRLYANDYYDRINALKIIMDKKGTVDVANYKELINEIKNKVAEKQQLYLDSGKDVKVALNNQTIDKLESDVNDFSIKINDILSRTSNQQLSTKQIMSNEKPLEARIGSIKSIKSGINLNVKHITYEYLGKSTYEKMKLDLNHHNIMIFLNNGCLTYLNDKYTSKHCEVTNRNQYFIFKTINNGEELLNHLKDDYKDQQININKNDNPDLYPFNIIYPIDDQYKCLEIDYDGISIVNCRSSPLNINQRWISSPTTKKGCY